MPTPSDAKNRPQLTYAIGDHVECWWQPDAQRPGQWLLGVVTARWWRAPHWPEGRYAPYQVRLQDGSLIYAPNDSGQCIREAAPQLEGQPAFAASADAMGTMLVPPPPEPSEVAWRKAKTPNGETYWFHPVTKESRWDEPPPEGRDSHAHAHAHAHGGGCGAAESTQLPEKVRAAAASGEVEAVEAYLRQHGRNIEAVDASARGLLLPPPTPFPVQRLALPSLPSLPSLALPCPLLPSLALSCPLCPLLPSLPSPPCAPAIRPSARPHPAPQGRTLLMAAAHGPRGAALVPPLVAAGASLDARDEHGSLVAAAAAYRPRAVCE